MDVVDILSSFSEQQRPNVILLLKQLTVWGSEAVKLHHPAHLCTYS